MPDEPVKKVPISKEDQLSWKNYEPLDPPDSLWPEPLTQTKKRLRGKVTK